MFDLFICALCSPIVEFIYNFTFSLLFMLTWIAMLMLIIYYTNYALLFSMLHIHVRNTCCRRRRADGVFIYMFRYPDKREATLKKLIVR